MTSVEREAKPFEREAVVAETISPHSRGQVRFQGTWWSARCEQEITIPAGTIVYVTGRWNITLLVEPISKEVLVA